MNIGNGPALDFEVNPARLLPFEYSAVRTKDTVSNHDLPRYLRSGDSVMFSLWVPEGLQHEHQKILQYMSAVPAAIHYRDTFGTQYAVRDWRTPMLTEDGPKHQNGQCHQPTFLSWWRNMRKH